MTSRRHGPTWIAVGCLMVNGCYRGLDGSGDAGAAPAADDGDSDDDDAGGDDAGDGTADDGGELSQPTCVDPVAHGPLRRLTRTQYTHAVRDLLGVESDAALGFSSDEKIGAFYSNGVAPVSDLDVGKYMDAAESIALEAVADLDVLLDCDITVHGDACVDSFIADFGRRAWRRPLRETEFDQMRDLFATASSAGGSSAGVRLVVQAFLQSPYFLYQVEIGEPDLDGDGFAALTDFEVASRLSFFLWDSVPDPTLLDAAEDGSLGERGVLRDHALRMLDDPRAKQAIASFHLQWFGVHDMTLVEKDAELFPDFDEARRQAMRDETADFADWVVREGDGSLETLFTAPFTIIDERLAEVYGVTLPEDHVAGELVDLDPTQRAGLLTHASVLSVNAHSNQSSPVHRGAFVRENLLCQLLPQVPDDVDDVPPEPTPGATTRERFAEHTANPSCKACHELIDGIGFGFEHYDAVGAWRVTDSDLPVDASGNIVSTADADGAFVGAIDLAARLANSSDVRRCVAQQWFNFALGRVPSAGDQCSTDALYQRFEASGFNVRELLVALVESRAFTMRRLDGEGK